MIRKRKKEKERGTKSSDRHSSDACVSLLQKKKFLESFSMGHGVTPAMAAGTDHLVVPANFLDKWFQKFQAKFRRDPDFLTRNATPV